MPTPAQIAANRQNAQASTGPRSEDGKSRCAANATSFGLFSVKHLVRPDEAVEYAELQNSLAGELRPATVMEQSLAAEILHALWRLRRCALAESTVDSETDPLQASVDRARAQAAKILRHATEELRRLQTERHLRAALGPVEGLASHTEIAKTLALDARRQLLRRQLDETDTLETLLQSASHTAAQEIANQTQPPHPRNAPCPCGSRQKYKRCCGGHAPPVLQTPLHRVKPKETP